MEVKRSGESTSEAVGADSADESGDFGEGLDGAKFVIGERNRDKIYVVGESLAEGGEVDESSGGNGDKDGLMGRGSRQDSGMLSAKDKSAVVAGGKGEVDRLCGTSSNNEVGTLGADGMSNSILRGLIGFADVLSGKIGGGGVEKLLRKIRSHGLQGGGQNGRSSGMIKINHGIYYSIIFGN